MDDELRNKTIFSLKPLDNRGKQAIRHPANKHYYSKGRLNFKLHSTKDSNPLTTIAILGSGKGADVLIPGKDIASIHCAFVINYKSGVVLIEDRSLGWTQVRNFRDQNFGPLNASRGHPRVITMTNVHRFLVLGKDRETQLMFEIKFNLGIDASRKLIQRRVSGAALSLQQRHLRAFPGQTPQRRDKKIHHRMLYELGKGAFGSVFKTVDLYSGDVMAVKEMIGHPFIERSRDRELYAYTHFNHPHIMNFLGYHIDPRSLLTQIFMPVQNGSVADLTYQIAHETSSREQVEDMGVDALMHCLSGLDYIASHGFVHRDIKPQNILYSINHRGDYIYKCSDFGLADLVENVKSLAGTELYLSPETQDGFKQTPKSDLYSLFVTMLWIFNTDNFMERIIKRIRRHSAEVRTFVLRAAIGSEKMRYFRDMSIYDPEVRASAGQMLATYGRFDLMTSRNVDPLPENYYQSWCDSVFEDRSPYTFHVKSLLGITTKEQLRRVNNSNLFTPTRFKAPQPAEIPPVEPQGGPFAPAEEECFVS